MFYIGVYKRFCTHLGHKSLNNYRSKNIFKISCRENVGTGFKISMNPSFSEITKSGEMRLNYLDMRKSTYLLVPPYLFRLSLLFTNIPINVDQT
jgi:hypothetical protein